MRQRVLRWGLEILEVAIAAFSIYLVCYLFLFQPNRVEGNSMYPTLANGDRVFTNKLVYRFGLPKRGDVVVFTPPGHLAGNYIKRIVGLPGDLISIRENKVYVNGNLLSEPYLGRVKTDGGEYIVPTESYFLLGDNRHVSMDSRQFGMVSRRNIVGRVGIVYWPLGNIGLVRL